MSCGSSDDCAYPTPYCSGLHACVECLSDRNCSGNLSGTHCNAFGNCAECVDDTQCSSYLPYCDDTFGACVECRTDKNCGSSGVRCLSGQCGRCGDGICTRLETLTGCYDCGCTDPFPCYDAGFGGSGGYYDAGPSTYCGDGYADFNEDCDGFDLGYYSTCSAATFGALPYGTLRCSPFCTYDVSGCRSGGFGGFGGTFGRDAGTIARPPPSDAGSSLARRCVPGEQVRCACPHGDGVQACRADGQSYAPCVCTQTDAGTARPRNLDAGTAGRPNVAEGGPNAASSTTNGGCGCELGSAETRPSVFALAALAMVSLYRRSRRR